MSRGRKKQAVCPKCGAEIIEVTREAYFDYEKERLHPAQPIRRCLMGCGWEHRVRQHGHFRPRR